MMPTLRHPARLFVTDNRIETPAEQILFWNRFITLWATAHIGNIGAFKIIIAEFLPARRAFRLATRGVGFKSFDDGYWFRLVKNIFAINY
jgi:hypothetical protein